jgi:hypothetical protein
MHKQQKQTDHFKRLYGKASIMLWFGHSIPNLNSSGKYGVDNDRCELQQLSLCQVSFPWTAEFKQTQGVVGIHHDVDPRVQKGTKICISTWVTENGEPPTPSDGNMMIDMQKRDLKEVIWRSEIAEKSCSCNHNMIACHPSQFQHTWSILPLKTIKNVSKNSRYLSM